MPFLFSLIPATVIAVVGFFVLFASARAEGTVQKVGKVLGIWIFVLALLPLVGGAYVAVTGQCPLGGHMSGYHMSGSHMSMRGHGGYPKGDKMAGCMEPGTMPGCVKSGAMPETMPETMMTPETGE